MIAAFAWLALFTPAEPLSYLPYRIHELALLADQVVVGTLAAVDDATYDLTVEEVLAGAPGEPVLRVKRFEDWACASRWAPYRTGQRVLLFLKNGQAMGAGNEGDMPLLEHGVLVRGPVRGFRLASRTVDGGSHSSCWVPLDHIRGTLSELRACVSFGRGKSGYEAQLVVPASRLRELQRRTEFARGLVEELVTCKCFRSGAEFPLARPRPAELQRVDAAVVGALLARERKSPPGLELLVGCAPSAVVALGMDQQERGRIELSALEPRDESLPFAPRLGCSMSWRGLLPGDGDALVAGAPSTHHAHQGEAGPHHGSIWILDIDAQAGVERAIEIGDEHDSLGLVDGCAFGDAVASVGDLDGDGVSEIAVSRMPDATWCDGSLRSGGNPSVALLFLDEQGRLRKWKPLELALGPSALQSGIALAGLGDVDGNGYRDLAIGEPLSSVGGPFRGAVHVALLGREGNVSSWSHVDGDDRGLALRDGDELGVQLAALGDVNGDGVPDVVAAGANHLWLLHLSSSGEPSSSHRRRIDEVLPGCSTLVALSACDGEIVTGARYGPARPIETGIVRLRPEELQTR